MVAAVSFDMFKGLCTLARSATQSWSGMVLSRDGDICKYQYRYHIDIFFRRYRYIDISHPLKTTYFQFFMKYTVTHEPNDHAFIT